MFVAGVILLIVGLVLGWPLLWMIGLVLLVVGGVLLLASAVGRPVGSRRYW